VSSLLVLCLLTLPSAVGFVPQLVRLVRTRDAAGLSPTSLLVGSVNHTAWSVYLWWAETWGLLAANLVSSVMWYALTVLGLRLVPLGRSWHVPLAWGLVVLVAGTQGRILLGVVLGVGSLVTFAPQAVRAWTAPSLRGVSVSTWWLLAAQGVGWSVVSLPAGLIGGSIFGVVALLASASVLAAVAVRKPVPVGDGAGPGDGAGSVRSRLAVAA